jgi:hypothetical protein
MPGIVQDRGSDAPFSSSLSCVSSRYLHQRNSTDTPELQTLSRTAIMERSIDQRNATDRASASEPAAHECQQDRLPDPIRHRDQFVAVPEQPTLHERPVDLAEQPEQDGDNAGAATLSMEETLKRYIPDDSDMARSIKQRKTQVWSIAEGDHWWHEGELNLDRLRKLQVQSTEGYIVLFIQDSNLDWCKALCAEYPGVLSPEDLAEHVIRFDGLPSTHLEWDPRDIGEKLGSLYPTAKIRVQPSSNLLCTQVTAERAESETSGFHLDVASGISSSEHKRHVPSLLVPDTTSRFRRDVFSKDASNTWRRISSRMSCVRLKAAALCKIAAPKYSDTDKEVH